MEKAIQPWLAIILTNSIKYQIPPHVIAGLILQESSGNTYAIRCERGFFKRYYKGLLNLIKRTTSKVDDQWFDFPELFSSSYGLCQVLYPIALEHGISLRYPTELCDPNIGIDAGCRHLRKFLNQTGGDIKASLLRYNGGGDLLYPTKVLDKGNLVKHLFS